MESIGTTKKQIMKILTLEGGIYALISTLLIMTFGNAFLMLVADAVPHIANYAVFEYPVSLVIEMCIRDRVWSYIGELLFNMLVLVGAVRMSDRIIREMMGL